MFELTWAWGQQGKALQWVWWVVHCPFGPSAVTPHSNPLPQASPVLRALEGGPAAHRLLGTELPPPPTSYQAQDKSLSV